MVVISSYVMMDRVKKRKWEAAAYQRLLKELDMMEYSSEDEKQAVRRYVKEAWKHTGLGKEEKVPPGFFLLA